MITIGKQFAFGTDEPLPLQGFPAGRYRLRLRPDDLAIVFVKTQDGIRKFLIEETDGKWTPGPEMARNIHGQTDTTPVSAALWLCNECGHEFEEMDAQGVDISPDSDERAIACPKCWANNLDEDDSLTHPDDRLPNR